MPKKKTSVVDSALNGLPVNYMIGFCQFVSGKGEQKTEWRVYHAFGDLIARDVDPDKCLAKAIDQYCRVAPKPVSGPDLKDNYDAEHFKAVLERLSLHVGADATLREAHTKLKEELEAKEPQAS